MSKYYRDEFGNMRPVEEQTQKLDPILGTLMHKNEGYQVSGTKVPKKNVSKPKTGLGKTDILAEALKTQKYNQDNKYRIGTGLNINNQLGDTIGRIANQLLK